MKQLSKIPFASLTITIYNKYTYENSSGKLITSWSRMVIPNCFRTTSQSIFGGGSVYLSEDKTAVQVPMFDNYLEPFDWANLPNDDARNYFTVNDGDLIVLREVDDDINDFSVIEAIEKKYGSLAFKIGSVNYNYGTGYPLPHILAVSI